MAFQVPVSLVKTGRAQSFTIAALVAVAYIAAAKIGFRAAFVAEQVTTVWAPTGIAIAALLLWGQRLWPAIWVGAFVVNATTSAPLWTAVIVAGGNTLEAVAAAWLLRRIEAFDASFRRVADVVAFIAIAAVACTMISASIGVATLCTAGVQPWERFGALWFDWWLGDALGALVIAPAILIIAGGPRLTARDAARLALFTAASVAVTHGVFGRPFGIVANPLEYVVFPLVVAAAVIGGPGVTAFVVLSSSIVTIADTIRSAAAFPADVHQTLILLQTFMGVLAATALLLSAAIAERKTAELRERQAAETLRHRDEILRLAQRAGGVATFAWDFQHQLANCSAEFFAIFGLPAREGVMTGAEWAQFVHPDDRERMAAHLARALERAEMAVADYRIVCADGTTRWLSYAGQLQDMPEGTRMIGTVVDITDRKRLESNLRHHADVLSLAMRGASMGAWSRDLVTNEVWWSRELEEIVGLDPGAFGGTETGFFHMVHPDDQRAVRRAVDTAIATGSDYEIEFRFRHASGEWRWMEGRGRVLPAPDGTAGTLYGVGMDVTARKRSETALQEAKEAAESANRLKDQFLATLSHELRTPLNAILGYARMLQTNSIPPEKRQKALDIIERNAGAQNQLIEDLLDISRITRGQVRLDPTPIPIAPVLREAAEGVRPAADAKRIALSIDIDPFAGTVLGDATRLQQVFWNLLTNAVKFTEAGGSVTASVRPAGDHVEVSVSDTGMGISPDFLPFVFEPFRQADGNPSREHGGLGLGLAISKQLVELHGGTIRAASPGPGRGATFIARIPCHRDASADRAGGWDDRGERAARGASASTSVPLQNVDILLVDDEEDTLSLFRESLETAGASVRAVTNARDAIRATSERRPDLLVTDLGLPGMDGFKLLEAVREIEPDLPAIAVTAYARLDDRTQSLAAGFQAHVSKPVDPDAFVYTLAATLTQAK